MSHLDPIHVQLLAAVLFALGLAVTLTRRNIFFLLMGVELMLNAVNLSFIGFARTVPGDASLTGHLSPLFIIAIAAAEACVGLAMVICIVRNRDSLDSDAYADMKE
ncbi:MAG: NADH-quinone oxidoreductase subunit NuoK [Planctomycetes bacterium]|nr:NADH-quinone oxidoreductase subunit NuoK [Planctomycetota bacterium]